MKMLEVSDYLEASGLVAAGARLVETAPDSRGRCALRFDNTDGQAEEMLSRHRSGRLEVSSLAMAMAVKSVKDSLFAARREAGFERGGRRALA